MTYTCLFCGKETPGFDCTCQKKLENQNLWNSGDRKKLKNAKNAKKE